MQYKRVGASNVEISVLGLIRFATADNSSGERTYLAQVEAICFDALALKWNLANDAVTTTLVGAEDKDQLLNALSVIDHPAMLPEEEAMMQQLVQSPMFAQVEEDYHKRFTA